VTERRVIRMFIDNGDVLWEDGTERYPGKPSDFSLSEALTMKLQAWRDEWLRDFDVNARPPQWRPGRGDGWSERGADIAVLLQQEVGEYADVRYDGHPY
jgi:hypothetical protein